jgi:drug/metabolite transporter (DMT)-like permease
VIAVVCSLAAALLYAAASVFQHRAAIAAPMERSMRPGLLTHLALQPWWVGGVAADGLAFVLQFVALSHGPLIIVQPLLVSGLLFALPLGAILAHKPIRPAELWAAAAVVVGLAALLLAADPGRGHSAVHASAWIVTMVCTVVPIAVLSLAAALRPGVRAGLLATAAGVTYGLSAALTKSTAHLLALGIGRMLSSWQPYCLVAAGALGMLLCQSAFQAGPLRASLPLLTIVDPVVSIVIGVTLFHERIDQNPLRLAISLVAAAVMTVGVVALSRSPLIDLAEEPVPDAVAV